MIIGIELDEMPKDCYECPFQIRFKDGVQDDWYMRRCTVKNRTIEYPRPEWCPLKEQETELEQKLKEQENAYSELSKEYLSLVRRAAHRPNVVRCKECVHRGNPKKCILAFVAEKQDFPVSFYDNRGDWFCGDGKRTLSGN